MSLLFIDIVLFVGFTNWILISRIKSNKYKLDKEFCFSTILL